MSLVCRIINLTEIMYTEHIRNKGKTKFHALIRPGFSKTPELTTIKLVTQLPLRANVLKTKGL